MQVKLGISARHVHLCHEDLEILFGSEFELEKRNDLTQPGEYASSSTVTIRTEKSSIDNVRILGPLRSYSQVEISVTDSYKLGIMPPVRNSGDLEGAALIEIVGPVGSVKKECAIVAARHIHMLTNNPYGFTNNERVQIKVGTTKKGILGDVYIKTHDNYAEELHLDTDDANAFMLKNGDMVEIIKGSETIEN